ncbi:FecR family protein [Mucilaginibacter auburnensis]|uniref:Ferric-dicitrate binding protein FerR (Iron transport regulator) n=1 Tax=Mucilaginibacter auburnensis TaxID=1457233 RepID=A0A2H9VLS1_9SPHI|nr:FecR family protein [Mucilaginibacter auburnensis]PJJ79245.1 ferric-dicitrate binding protein FerR (iron transport regulator) [Mucilaginibacter auburnensis]
MNNYRNYEVEDFVCDDFFIDWVLNPKTDNSAFWDNWQRTNPDRAKYIQNARAILLAIRVKENNVQLTEREIENLIQNVQLRIAEEEVAEAPNKTTLSFLWLKVAASIVILFSLGIAYNYIKNEGSARNHDLATGKVREVEFTRIRNTSKEGLVVNLADGSIVVLRPNSTLSFPKIFVDSTREVTLDGTGFFEVKRNPKMPFIVHARSITTRVLGTSFTVSSAVNQASKVIVYTGKVMVNRADNKKTNKWVVITPNQQVTYVPSIEELKKDTVLNHQPLSVDVASHVFIFNETPFADVIEQLERAYNITIDYSEHKFGKTSVSGDISKLPLDEKIQFISKAVNAKCQIETGRVKIY